MCIQEIFRTSQCMWSFNTSWSAPDRKQVYFLEKYLLYNKIGYHRFIFSLCKKKEKRKNKTKRVPSLCQWCNPHLSKHCTYNKENRFNNITK
ncbi:hypothetical protein GDO86_003986 [Hymenochirus boettgeri]|uniref:Uncharacterized protein n=1 Tax=Hymenochirus boettgeri TaxID=247094 RepID=A0A8T2KBM2_9PIPI|nr:hypothetical protein GDO86_003986 [Hymenochirus boettgeri]